MIRFEWDEKKNQINLFKHGLDFETAQLVFDDPTCLTFIERTSGGENRWHAIGSIEGLFMAVVVHTDCENGVVERVRIVSARQATRRERTLYEEANS